jgi:hypothetical protein
MPLLVGSSIECDRGRKHRVNRAAAFHQHAQTRLRRERLRCRNDVARGIIFERIGKLPVEGFMSLILQRVLERANNTLRSDTTRQHAAGGIIPPHYFA